MRKLLKWLIRLEQSVRHWLKESSPFSHYFYDLKNTQLFEMPSSHEAMLADGERIDKYYEGIQRRIRKGDIVLDLGTGTGILSFFAARLAGKVYAVEHSSVIEVAKKVCAENKFNNIEFFRCNSRDLHLPIKVDAIIHEQIGAGNPFSENMIENLLDARDRLLKAGGRIVPNRFEIYLEPIELKDAYRIPFLWEFTIKSVSFQSLRPTLESLPATGRRIIPGHSRVVAPHAVKRCLCIPKPIFRFDLEAMNEGDLSKRVCYRNTADQDGRIDGLCLYFKAFFDDEVSIENSPMGLANHWALRMFRIEATEVGRGDVVEYDLEIDSFIDDSTWALTWLQPKARTRSQD
jgi:protein arginine N-methyltransferase 1